MAPRKRPELEADLAAAVAKLEALPPAHLHRHPHAAIAKRVALTARVRSLREQLSTAPVQEVPNIGDNGRETGDSSSGTTSTPRATSAPPSTDARP